VIRQDSRNAASIRWSFVRSDGSTAAKRNARREPEMPP